MNNFSNIDQNNINGQQNTSQLEFSQAMADFKTMFPTLEKEVIEIVLRSNRGEVDSTIDQLLQMTGENQNNAATVNQPPMYFHKDTNSNFSKSIESKNLNDFVESKEKICKTSLKQMNLLDNQNTLINFDSISDQPSTSSLRKSRFNPPLLRPLPDDFLRINLNKDQNVFQNHSFNNISHKQINNPSNEHQFNPYLLQKKMKENERQRMNINVDNPGTAQYLEDERIAIMLQNEEFVSELKRNKEFLNALNNESLVQDNSSSQIFRNSSIPSASNACSFDSNQNFSDADFKERIRNMGKLSRRKFAQLAGLFSRNKSSMPSRDNLLVENSDDNYTQLKNDYSDSEEYYDKKNFNSAKR